MGTISTDSTWSLRKELLEIRLPTVESNFKVVSLEELLTLKLKPLYVDENRACPPQGVSQYIIHSRKKRSVLDNLWTALTLALRLAVMPPGDDGYIIILDIALDDDVMVQQCHGSGCDDLRQILRFLWKLRGLIRAPIYLRPVGEVGDPNRCPQQMKLLSKLLSVVDAYL